MLYLHCDFHASALAAKDAQPWLRSRLDFDQQLLLLAGGPLGWLYPSEIQPLETRSAGQGIATLVNLLFSFIIGQTYLSMLCAMKVTLLSCRIHYKAKSLQVSTCG